MYVDVAVSGAKDRKKDFFTYFSSRPIPKGTLVYVPFGKKTLQGIVFDNKASSTLSSVLPVLRIAAVKPVITPAQIALITNVAEFYHTSVSQLLGIVLPDFPAASLKNQLPAAPSRHPGKQTLVIAPTQKFLREIESSVKRRDKPYVIYHGDMPAKERAAHFLNLLTNPKPLILATKTGLFLPFLNLKQIVVYEEHDWAYREQRTPHYHAMTVAKALAQTTGASLTVRDNTPRVETFYESVKGRAPYTLAKTFPNLKPPRLHFVDIANEKRSGNEFLVSEPLAEAVKTHLKKRQPILLYLNKKNDGGLMRCEACNHALYQPVKPAICPNCKSADIRFDVINVKQVAATINRYLKLWGVSHAMWDSQFQGSLISLTIGDTPRLTIATQKVLYVAPLNHYKLLGVIFADTLLDLPEFRAAEKTFATLTQLTTLLKSESEAVIQTRHPDHPVFETFAKLDYPQFAKAEIKDRKAAHYPPFARLVLCSFSAKSEETVKKHALSVGSAIQNYITAHPYSAETLEVVGPYPRLHTPSEIRILLKSRDQEVLQHVLNYIPSTWKIDFDPENIVT